MSETIAAVIVTYNRKGLLVECIDALLRQSCPVDRIIIVDNASTDGTPDLLIEKGYLSNPMIDFVRLPENTGGAGGFHEGVKRGYEAGYDWLWLMDDDAEPENNALNELIKYKDERNICALASAVGLPSGEYALNHRGLFYYNQVFPRFQTSLDLKMYDNKNVEIDMASFVGILIRRKSIEAIGLPRNDFFIHHDDVEYCLRLRQVGRILLIPKSLVLHKEAAKSVTVDSNFLLSKSKRIPYDKLWIKYYGTRNLIWIGKKYSKNRLRFYLTMIKTYIRLIIGIFIYDDNKYRRIYFHTNSYLDGIRGVFDNNKARRLTQLGPNYEK